MFAAGKAHLFLAQLNGDDLAGVMVYTLGSKMWYQYGASRSEGRNLMAANLLQWEVMRWGKRRGFTSYDMLAVPSPPHLQEDHPWWGLYRFKNGFGGHMLDTVGTSDLVYDRRVQHSGVAWSQPIVAGITYTRKRLLLAVPLPPRKRRTSSSRTARRWRSWRVV